MNLFRPSISRLTIGALALIGLCTSCLGDGNQSETIVTDYNNPTITSVSFSSNTKVCAALDSYKFTIDQLGNSDPELIQRCKGLWEGDEYTQQPGILFNADSLPVGTVADSIKVSMNYSAPYSVKFYQYDEDLNLLHTTNFADTQIIFFDDYAVTRVEITAKDRLTKKSYFFKVNVHTIASDTIQWQYLAEEIFDASSVIDQRVDTVGTTLCWYTTLSDHSQQVRTADLCGDVTVWSDPQAVVASAELDLGTLYNWNGLLYAVATDGSLQSSSDGISWSVASSAYSFVSLLGVQLPAKNNGEYLQAIANVGGEYSFVRSNDGATWTLNTVVVGADTTALVPAGFPIHDFTRPISVAANLKGGSTTSRIYISGGVLADGTMTASTWTCDSAHWVEFDQTCIAPQRRATIIQYRLSLDNDAPFWIMQTGERENGTVSDTLYFSENCGINWRLLSREFYKYGDTYQIAPFGCSSGFYNPQNYRIYFIGGRDQEGRQTSQIVTGLLNKLAMKPKR